MRRFVLLLCLLACLGPANADENAVEARLQAMSLRQKVGQMMVLSFFGNPPNQPTLQFIAEYQPGAVVLLPSNLGDPATITRLTNSLQAASQAAGAPPLLIAVDQEGGIIAHLEQGFTRWPVPMLWTATGNADLVQQVGQAMATEMRAVGINMNLAPVADLNTNPANPIIGRRSFGSNPQQVAPLVAAYAAGLQAGGVLATAKHFPGHGDTDSDSHTTLPVVNHNLFRLQSTELLPFRALIEADVAAVMVAHIAFPQLDPVPDRPASLSPVIVTNMLREGMGYEGLILPDAMDMDAIDTVYSPPEAARLALVAGHDLILLGAHVSLDNQAAAIEGIVAAVEAGDIPVARIDDSVRRILRAKARVGALEGWQALDAEGAAAAMPLVAHTVLVQQLFAEGIALGKGDPSQVAIQNETAFIYPGTRPSLWAACQSIPNLRPLAVHESPTPEDIQAAIGQTSLSQRALVFTLNADSDPAQQALVNALPPEKTWVVALQSPADSAAWPDVAGYLLTYSPLYDLHTPLCAILGGQAPVQGQVVALLSSP